MKSLFALIFTALFAAHTPHAASPVTVQLTRTRQKGTSLGNVLHADISRHDFLKNGTTGGPTTIPITDVISEYTTRVGIGNPPTFYDLVVDTGSSNIFCGIGIPYNRTSTSISTGEHVNVTYGSGSFSGLEYLDQVTLAPNLTISNQSIGDALAASGIRGFDGIIGLASDKLTSGTLTPDKNATIPTVMDNLISQRLIEKKVLSVYFTPPMNRSHNDGALTYGGADPSLYQGNVTYVNVTETYPAAHYWGINITSASYANHTIIPSSTAGIVDTGTTLVYFARDFFTAYKEAIPGARHENLGFLAIPRSSVPFMKPLDIVIGGRTFTLDASAQLIPEEEVQSWGEDTRMRYSVVVDTGRRSGFGFDFILGKKFMERFLAVFDSDNNRVGFAYTNVTFSD